MAAVILSFRFDADATAYANGPALSLASSLQVRVSDRKVVRVCHLLCLGFCVSAAGSLWRLKSAYCQSGVNWSSTSSVCLDGSPPAYHLSPGFGSGSNNWLVHMEGGGWCKSVQDCLARKNTFRGSSKYMKPLSFSGILGNSQKLNPDFYNWNKVKIRYCDGSSFTGDVDKVDSATGLYFRGAKIWFAVMQDLLSKGMNKAEKALLSGCSAGGLASILHCDKFRDLLPRGANVKCFSDAGYFVNLKDISGTEYIKAYYSSVVNTHGSAKNLPSSCTSRLTPSMCFFPQYVVPQMRTPLFILNAAYDAWQIKNILAPSAADPKKSWNNCKLDIKHCTSNQLQIMQGMFINSCYAHCQSGSQNTWLAADSPMLDKNPIAKAVGDWFYRRRTFQKIDCPYPCDSSCRNRVYE